MTAGGRVWDSSRRQQSVAASLLVVGTGLESSRIGASSTPLIASAGIARGFGFLVGVIADFGIQAERAWRIPGELEKRLGTLEPNDLRERASDIGRSFRDRPVLHRFPDRVAAFICAAAVRVADEHGGVAESLWNDRPTAADLQARLQRFEGIGQKKAAMAVDLLSRELGVAIRTPSGNDVAYDVHVRRVFQRTGIVRQDTPDEVIAAARALSPERPAALDYPSWHIGRTYCRPAHPLCGRCPLEFACEYAETNRDTRGLQLVLFRT